MYVGPGLVLLVLVLILAGPMFGHLLKRHGVANGHELVNHWFPGLLVVGLLVVFAFNSSIVSDYLHSLDGRTNGHLGGRTVIVATATPKGVTVRRHIADNGRSSDTRQTRNTRVATRTPARTASGWKVLP